MLEPAEAAFDNVAAAVAGGSNELDFVVAAALIALAITVPGIDSDDRAAVIREVKEMFLGFFRELVRLVRELCGGGGRTLGAA